MRERTWKWIYNYFKFSVNILCIVATLTSNFIDIFLSVWRVSFLRDSKSANVNSYVITYRHPALFISRWIKCFCKRFLPAKQWNSSTQFLHTPSLVWKGVISNSTNTLLHDCCFALTSKLLFGAQTFSYIHRKYWLVSVFETETLEKPNKMLALWL